MLSRSFPDLSKHTQPIFVAQLLDQRLAVTPHSHDLHQILQPGSISYSCRDRGAVKIGSKADAVLADMFENMLEVVDHQFNQCIRIPAAIWPEEARREVDPDNTAGFTDRSQLNVGKIPGMRAQSMRIGMRGDEGRIADSGNVPEPAFIEVRQINQNPQPVAGADQFLTEVRQTRSSVGRRGTTKRHAMPEGIGPAPNRPRERSPASYNTSRSSKFGSIASAPSI